MNQELNRLAEYLQATIADKEAEQLRTEGELSAMHSLLAFVRNLTPKEVKQ